MKTLHNLDATLHETTWDEPRGVVQAVHDEPLRGFFRQICLGSAGLTIRRGDAVVGIPLQELVKLAARFEPSLEPSEDVIKAAQKSAQKTRIAARPVNAK